MPVWIQQEALPGGHCMPAGAPGRGEMGKGGNNRFLEPKNLSSIESIGSMATGKIYPGQKASPQKDL